VYVSENGERPFIVGLDLSQMLYREAVQPILDEHHPGIPYSAALIGRGSEVLGFDTPQSMDHDWGPRLMLFLREEDHHLWEEIDRTLREELPLQIHGYPTHYVHYAEGTAAMQHVASGPVHHLVTFHTVRGFFRRRLNWDVDRDLCVVDWLTFPQQYLRSVTAGCVFYDGLGQLEPTRDRLCYYPHDVWLYLLACQWTRISQEDAFMGRCGQVGDELGSRLVGARLVRDLMGLCFLMERQYAPYIKWLGTAFSRLDCAASLEPLFAAALSAGSWQEREAHLSPAYEFVARMHNDLGVTAPLPTTVSSFHERPFRVIHGERFAKALQAAIVDEQVRSLPPHLGAVDQFIDSTDVLDYPQRFDRLKLLYR
jgi:hypothetical protein